MAMICTSQVCLGRGVCILFQKKILMPVLVGVGLIEWSPIIYICAGICGRAMCV